jgi:hypothetical protein
VVVGWVDVTQEQVADGRRAVEDQSPAVGSIGVATRVTVSGDKWWTGSCPSALTQSRVGIASPVWLERQMERVYEACEDLARWRSTMPVTVCYCCELIQVGTTARRTRRNPFG